MSMDDNRENGAMHNDPNNDAANNAPNDKQERKRLSRAQLALRIGVPAALVVLVAGIWAVKNLGPNTVPVAGSQAPYSAQAEQDESTCYVAPPAITGSDAATAPAGDTGEIAQQDATMSVENGIDLDTLTGYGVPVLLKFGAVWCGPCQTFAPVLEDVHTEYAGKVIIKDIDVDEYGELAAQFPISIVPTTVLFDSEGNAYTPEADDPLGAYLKLYQTKDTQEHVYTTLEGAVDKDALVALLTRMGMQQ